MSFGTYPELSLREARALVASGTNPHVHRKQQRLSARLAGENTFEAVFQLWHAHRSLSLKKGRQTDLPLVERVFARAVFPLLGKRPVYDIKRHDLLDVLARVERRRAFSVAKKLRCWFNQMFRYALIKVPGLETNPASDLDVADPSALRSRRDSPGESKRSPGIASLVELDILGANAVGKETGCKQAALIAQLRAYHQAKGVGPDFIVRADERGALARQVPLSEYGKLGGEAGPGDF